MAPMPEDVVDDRLKDVIQNLFEIQSAVHGYLGPETQQELVRKVRQLTTSLSTLSTVSSSLPVELPPEIIEFIEEGRNPDIYTRDLIEVVQRGNRYLKGKSEAFAGFRDVLAEEIVKAKPQSKSDVKLILEGRGVAELPKQNGEAGDEGKGSH